MDLPDESDDTELKPNGGYFNELPVGNDFDGWYWHINVKQNIELELNDDNSVLSAVDFKAKSVVESGDPTALMAFHFAKGHEEAIGISSHLLGGDSANTVGRSPCSLRPRSYLVFLHTVFTGYSRLARTHREDPPPYSGCYSSAHHRHRRNSRCGVVPINHFNLFMPWKYCQT